VNMAQQGEAPDEGVVADYLANRLSEAEAQSFEHYCLEHPEFAREVERELALKTGLRRAHQSVAQVIVPTHKRRYGRWSLAFAACIAVLASTVLIIQHVTDKQRSLVAFASTVDIPDQLRRSAVSQVRLVRVRGNDVATQVSASAGGIVEIELLPGLNSKSGGYSIQISAESPSSTKRLTIRNLRPAADGYLKLYVPADQIIGRTWLISVAQDGDLKSQSRGVFRVQFVNASGSAN
jgi:hypothetical protein